MEKKLFFIGIPAIIVLAVVAMALLQACPPEGPWPMPPWCGENGAVIPLPFAPVSQGPLSTKIEVVTPFSTQGVFFKSNGNEILLERSNEIYASGIAELSYGDPYTITMGGASKQGVFTGGYAGFLSEARRTGTYPFSPLPVEDEMRGVDEFLFDHLPLSGSGRPLVKGIYTGMETTLSDKHDFTGAIVEQFPRMKAMGANWVNFVPVWFFFPSETNPEKDSSELRPVYSDEYYSGLQGDGYIYATTRDDDLKFLIQEAHRHGLKVYLVPHIAPINYGPDSPRGKASIYPEDIDEFFKNYEKMIVHYAKLSEETGVELLGLGCEVDSLVVGHEMFPGTDLDAKWRGLIRSARSEYGGKLTYSSAGTPEFNLPAHINFWDELDYIGYEWYIPLTDDREATLGELIGLSTAVIEEIFLPLHEEYGKPILITETGIEAKPYVWTRFYEGSSQSREVDRLAAASGYEYLFQAIEQYDFVEGMFIWSMHASEDGESHFPTDMWWMYANDGNEIQHSIVMEQISKWFNYYS